MKLFHHWLPRSLTAAILFKIPFIGFLLHFSKRQGLEPWDQGYQTWCIWDCTHYASLSDAYTVENVGFFPGFPWVIQLFRAITGIASRPATLLAANFFTLIGLVLIAIYCAHLQAANDLKSEWKTKLSATPLPWLTMLGLAIFPASHFWSSGYAEPLFHALFCGALLAAMKKNWLITAALIGLCGIVRHQGMWLAGAFSIWMLVELARSGPSTGLSRTRILIAGALSALPVIVFHGCQKAESGEFFHYITLLKSGWNRGVDPLQALQCLIPRYDFSFGCLLLSVICAGRFLRRDRLEWKLLGVSTLILALGPLPFGGFSGYGRYMSTNIGLFIGTAEVLVAMPILTYATSVWLVFRLAIEIEGWTLGQWRG